MTAPYPALLAALFWSMLTAFGTARAQELDVQNQIDNGIALSEAGDLTGALQVFGRLTIAAPLEPDVWYNRAVVYMRMAEWPLALADLNRCLELRPEDDWATLDKGLVLMETGRLADALTQLTAARRLNPAMPEVYQSLGILHLELKDPTLACQAWLDGLPYGCDTCEALYAEHCAGTKGK